MNSGQKKMYPVAKVLDGAWRLAAAAAAVALLIFPAFKGVYWGYLPIAVGAAAAWRFTRSAQADAPHGVPHSHPGFMVALLAGTAVLQVGLVLAFRSQPVLDASNVYRQATELAEHGHMSPWTYYAPLQIWWYAGFFRIFGPSVIMAQLSNIPAVLALILSVHAIVRRIAGTRNARLAALMTALYPALVSYILLTPYYFYLYTLFIILSAALWLKAVRENSATAAALGGVAAALGALAKAVLLLAPLQALVVFALSARRLGLRRALILWAVFCLAFTATILPWTVRNIRVLGRPVPICTSGGLVLWSANNERSNGLYSPLPDKFKPESPQEFADYSRKCTRRALLFISRHPVRFITLAARKFLHTWGTETTFAARMNFRGRTNPGLDHALSFVFQTAWSFLVFSWLLNAGLRSRRHDPTWLLIAATIIFSHAAVYCLYEGGARHHLPLVPVIIAGITAALPSRRVRPT